MTEEIRNDILNASERGKKKYVAFHNERILSKTLKISATIHRMNLKTMISIKNKSTRTTKKVIREMNMAEKSIEIARDRGLATEDLLKYDVLPSPMLFDDHGLITKPEKSQLICELEDKLVSDDYSYHHKPESAFIIDVMATFRRVPLIGRTHFSDLLLQLTHITDVYHRYGRCDYIFDIYNDNPSVKDSERLRRCSVNPVVLSLVEQTTPLPKDMSTFWPSNKNKLLLEKLIYSYICEQSSQGHEHPTIVSQLCINSNDWQCKKIHHSTEHYMQRLGSTVEEADLHIPMHVLDCCRAGYKTCVVISNDTDVIVALLFYVPVFLQEGLMELWIRAGRGNTSRFLPLHTLYASLGRDLCTVLPAIHNLTGCDITSTIGTKKAALKANPETHLQGFSTSPPSSTSHQNLLPTSQGLKPHIYRAFYNAYITMHILNRQLNVRTENHNPVDYGFRLEDGQLLPSTSWKTLEARCSQKRKVPENGDVSRKTARCSAQQVAAILDSDDEETLGFDEDYPSDELETDSDDNVDNDNDSESDSDNEIPADRLPVRPVIAHNLDSGWNKKYVSVNKQFLRAETETGPKNIPVDFDAAKIANLVHTPIIVHTYGQKRCFCNYDMLTSGYYNFLINNGMSPQFLHNIFNICRQFSAMVCWNPAQESMKNYRYSKCHFCEKKWLKNKLKSTQNGGHFGHHVEFWEMYTLLGLSPKLF
ncbi:hypothetical protein GQR58_027383 [Nymphon striatum]|nr:hypothetical protein GQR58_027383 [Nymphon striatum]